MVYLVSIYYNESNKTFFQSIREALGSDTFEICFLIDSKSGGRQWTDKNTLRHRKYRALKIGKFVFYCKPRYDKGDTFIIYNDARVNLAHILFLLLCGKRIKSVLIEQSVKVSITSIEGLYKYLTTWLLYRLTTIQVPISSLSMEFASGFTLGGLKQSIGMSSTLSHLTLDRSCFSKNKMNFLHVGSDYKRKKVHWTYTQMINLPFSWHYRTAGDSGPSFGDNHTNFGFADRSLVNQLYSQSDVLILASSDEPWGHVVAEAIHCAIIPVVSSCVGSKDIIEKVAPELVFEMGNARSFADTILLSQAICSSVHLRQDYIKRLQKSLEYFSSQNVAQRFCELLKD